MLKGHSFPYMDTLASRVAVSGQFIALLYHGLPEGYHVSKARHGGDETGVEVLTFYWASCNVILDVLCSEAECSLTSRRHNVLFAFYADDVGETADECI